MFGADGHNLRRDAPASGSAVPAMHAASFNTVRRAVVEAVERSQTELQGLLRELIAFRTESQAKEATHFPEEARRCIDYVAGFLEALGFEIEGWDWARR